MAGPLLSLVIPLMSRLCLCRYWRRVAYKAGLHREMVQQQLSMKSLVAGRYQNSKHLNFS